MYILAVFNQTNTMVLKDIAAGSLIGVINSLLGSGGGLITVPYLAKKGLSQQQAQATSTAVILSLSILSTILYSKQELFTGSELIPFIVPGIFGAILGGTLFKKIPANALKLIFTAFMLYAAVRMIFG